MKVPRRTPRQRRSQQTVDVILDATARVLVREGLPKLTTNRVAKVAGVSIGSLYQYFPNKDALVLAVAQRHSQRMQAMLAEHTVKFATASVQDAVRTYVHATLEAHAIEPELQRALLPAIVGGLEHFADLQRNVVGLVEAWLELHRDEILPRDLHAAAYILVTSVESIIHGSFAEPFTDIDLEEVADEVVDLVLRYLLPASALA